MTTTRWMMVLGLSMMLGCKAKAQVPPTEPPAPSSTVAVTPVAASPAPSSIASATPLAPPAQKVAPIVKQVADAKILVKRLVLAEGVEDREPVEPKTSFAKDGGKIFAFVELENQDRVASEIEVEFVPPTGAPRGNVLLRVGESPRWRTWAYTRGAREAGQWTAVVKNRRGEVLARAPFEITG